MQVVRYFVAFRVVKAAESVFSCVTCCSGCFSAYRRVAVMPHLDAWEHQTLLGAPATFGDDRALTNVVLRDWKVRYAANAVAHTLVPAGLHQFLRQQLRWKRSWTRESLILARFVWRKRLMAAAARLRGDPDLAGGADRRRALPALAADRRRSRRAARLRLGIYGIALAYGLYYLLRSRRYDSRWIYGVGFCFFYLAFMLWQTYWAILTARSSDWGTRPATAGAQGGGA